MALPGRSPAGFCEREFCEILQLSRFPLHIYAAPLCNRRTDRSVSLAPVTVRIMIGLRRVSVVLSLAAYLAASTAIRALHDHSASGHSASGHCCFDHASCDVGQSHENHRHGQNSAAGNESAHHEHPSPTNCEDSCFACRFVAAKSIPLAVVLLVERFETVWQLETPRPGLAPIAQLECALCRGPPSAA